MCPTRVEDLLAGVLVQQDQVSLQEAQERWLLPSCGRSSCTEVRWLTWNSTWNFSIFKCFKYIIYSRCYTLFQVNYYTIKTLQCSGLKTEKYSPSEYISFPINGTISSQDLLELGLSCSATTNLDLFLRPSRKVTTRPRMSSALLEVKVYSSPLIVARVKLWLCNLPPLKEQTLQIGQQRDKHFWSDVLFSRRTLFVSAFHNCNESLLQTV